MEEFSGLEREESILSRDFLGSGGYGSVSYRALGVYALCGQAGVWHRLLMLLRFSHLGIRRNLRRRCNLLLRLGANGRISSYQRYDIQQAARWIEQVLPSTLLLLVIFIRQYLQ